MDPVKLGFLCDELNFICRVPCWQSLYKRLLVTVENRKEVHRVKAAYGGAWSPTAPNDFEKTGLGPKEGQKQGWGKRKVRRWDRVPRKVRR